jgi:hypothetical protein
MNIAVKIEKEKEGRTTTHRGEKGAYLRVS